MKVYHEIMTESGISEASKYLIYIQRIAQMAQVFTWSSVLLFDREFRTQTKRTQARIDPTTGKLVCIRYNRGLCQLKQCRYMHVCNTCFGTHTEQQHKSETKNG